MTHRHNIGDRVATIWYGELTIGTVVTQCDISDGGNCEPIEGYSIETANSGTITGISWFYIYPLSKGAE
jgi:hypothetical protein